MKVFEVMYLNGVVIVQGDSLEVKEADAYFYEEGADGEAKLTALVRDFYWVRAWPSNERSLVVTNNIYAKNEEAADSDFQTLPLSWG